MSNSAARHKRAGTPQTAPKREPSLLPNLITFLASRGLHKPGLQPINFRAKKRPLDKPGTAPISGPE